MAKIKRTDNTKCWQGSKAVGTLNHCWWKCRLEPPNLEFSADSSNGLIISSPRNMLRRNMRLCSSENMYKKVPNAVIYNSEKPEAVTQIQNG